MPIIHLKGGLKYFYTDSGTPDTSNYRTFIIIHGHTCHSGTFQRLSSVARARNARVICVNRRGYPGTTPYTDEESRIIKSGTTTERNMFLNQQGLDLATLVDRVVKQCTLSKEGVTVVGWSMGNIFLLAFVAAISNNCMSTEIKETMQQYVKGIILWDPPIEALGIPKIPEGYIPLWDTTLPEELRRPVFANWVSSYFNHGDLTIHDATQLNFRDPDTSKEPTITCMTQEELLSVADFAGANGLDTEILGDSFAPALDKQTHRALFDPVVRDNWTGAKFYHLYGDACPWTIIHAAWVIEDVANSTGIEIIDRVIEGANHFPMWEDPETAFSALYECSQAFSQDNNHPRKEIDKIK